MFGRALISRSSLYDAGPLLYSLPVRGKGPRIGRVVSVRLGLGLDVYHSTKPGF